MPIHIRPESPQDTPQIHTLTTSAFPSPLEANIITALRAANSLTLSLVAVDSDTPTDASSPAIIVGHVAFSPVTITPASAADTGKWVGLGPVSVLPSRHGQGVGSDLVRAGLETLREQGVRGCVLLGSPKFYGRFGFRSDQGLMLDDVPPEYFMSLVLDGGTCPVGKVQYHEAFRETLPAAKKDKNDSSQGQDDSS
ncbi:hypothetical protein K4F52_009651 [Lecanicillium sp. MT-2017a]|nr:hypothetical protein K4F52_009651 [Lecanicillium sp. MT-2017a]